MGGHRGRGLGEYDTCAVVPVAQIDTDGVGENKDDICTVVVPVARVAFYVTSTEPHMCTRHGKNLGAY